MKRLLELHKPRQIAAFKHAVRSQTVVDHRDNAWVGTLTQLMSEFGFKLIGSGKYGSVFEKDNYPYVIKVFMRDVAYIKWLDYCKRNQDNPYIPKIKGKAVKVGNLFYAIRLEKLLPGNTSFFDIEGREDDKSAMAVVDYIYDNQRLMDMHDGNIMRRSNGHPVIIDPFYNWYKNNRFTIDPDDVTEFRNIL